MFAWVFYQVEPARTIMTALLHRLWNEEAGFLFSLELILAAIMLVFGMLAGMQVLRDAAAQELADLGMAIGAINNTYTYPGVTISGGGMIAGSSFTDALDQNDDPSPTSGFPAGGLALGGVGNPES